VLIVTCALIQDAHFPVRGGFAVLALIDSIVAIVAMVDVRWLTVEDRLLRVRRLFSRDSLERSAAAFGVRREFVESAAEYVVFVTDGFRHVDVASCASEPAAKRAVRRLTDALLGGGPTPNAAGEREVQRIEARWQRTIEEAQQLHSDYRASRGWRRALTITAVLGAACVALAFFLWYRAQMRP